jgi:GAF domain-containing protein
MNTDELIAQLDGLAAGGASMQTLLETAVNGLHTLDPRFHWTGIYELFRTKRCVSDRSSARPPSTCSSASARVSAAPRSPSDGTSTCPDVSKATNYLACSTDTRSELVVLIRSGETIWAQVDIDSHQLAAFDDRAEATVQRVADWLARAYQSRSHWARSAPERIEADGRHGSTG